MGGTSFDVSVVRNGRVNVVMQGEVDRMPVRIPMVEIRAIGAGGGSLAKVQRGKRLTVGPESAGSYPGPACYGRGGLGATVTDANVTLGRIDGEKFLGGGMRLDVEAARVVIDTEVAIPLGLPIEAAAEGLLAVVNAKSGRRDPPVVVREGRRPARIHHDRLWRRRRAARGRSRRRDRNPARRIPGKCQHLVRLWHSSFGPDP